MCVCECVLLEDAIACIVFVTERYQVDKNAR